MPELDLIALLRKQDRESKEALDERVQEWANYLANWRGEFSNGDPQTLDEKAKLLEVLEADTGVKGVGYEDKVFVMETYRDIEAILIRECQAFVDISTPFKMKRPRIRIGQLQKTTKVDYEAATAYCVDLWKERCREEYV